MGNKTYFRYQDNYYMKKMLPKINRNIIGVFIKVFLIQVVLFFACLYFGFFNVS